MLIIDQRFASLENINEYERDNRKAEFHAGAGNFLRLLAKELGLQSGEYTIRGNTGGPAVSGEVTLHSDTLYVQLSESCVHRGIGILFRTCRGRNDYCGGMNHWASMRELAANSANRTQFVDRLRAMGGL